MSNSAPPPEGATTPPDEWPESWLRDAICAAIQAAELGEYDGMNVSEHLAGILHEIDAEREDRDPVFGLTDGEANVL